MSLDLGFEVSVTAEGEFEAPDRLTCTGASSLGGLTFTSVDVVIIGNDAWIDNGQGYVATTADGSELADTLGMCPGSRVFWENFDFGEEFSSLVGQPDEINGVEAKRYDFAQVLETMGTFDLLPFELEG